MTTWTKTLTLTLTALLIAPAVALAQKVTADYDARTDFAQYRTWTWKDGTPAASPFNQSRIEGAVATELAKKGLLADAAEPDLHVVMHAASDEVVRYHSYASGTGYYRRWGWGMGTVTTYEDRQQVGAFTVELYDARTGELVWVGTASDTMSDKADKNEKKINKAAEKLFKKLPAAVS